jgi:hypothetical protein
MGGGCIHVIAGHGHSDPADAAATAITQWENDRTLLVHTAQCVHTAMIATLVDARIAVAAPDAAVSFE